jgi:hypothetical protein
VNRKLVAAAIAGAACVAALVRVAPLGPSLDIYVSRTAHNPQFDMYSVLAVVRGGESIDEMAIEPTSGPLRIVEAASMRDTPPGWKRNFQVMLIGGESASGAVRIVQKGRVSRTYDIPIGETKP